MANDIFPGASLVQLEEWGYPKGTKRATPPSAKAFSVIHITGNSRLPSAQNEVAWRKNDPGLQNSATFFVNRDGSVVQALGDPLHMDPWANGDVNQPDTSNPRIAAVLADGVNANQRTLVAIENVGYEPGNPITAEQEATCAKIIAHYHAAAGVPVNRETVIGHYQLNSVTRPNCPGHDKSVVDRIAALAGGGTETWAERMKRELAECEATVKRLRQKKRELQAEIDALEAEAADSQVDITRLRRRIRRIKQLVAEA